MKTLIEKLEGYRLDAGIKKTVIVKLVGANTVQQYNNWITRKNIPDDYKDRVIDLLKANSDELVLDAEILRKIERLPEDKARTIIELIDGMLPEESD